MCSDSPSAPLYVPNPMQIAAVNDTVDSNLATKPDVLSNANNVLALYKVTCIQVVCFLTEPRVSSPSERSWHSRSLPSCEPQ